MQVGYCLNNEFAPYVPKPILLYQYDNQTCDFQFTNGQQPVHITSYTPFGQDLLYNNENVKNWREQVGRVLIHTLEGF